MSDKLGIIGGMGPMATVCFLKKIIELTDADSDQEHIDIVIEHLPHIPDRTGYILDNTKPSPVDDIVAAGCELARCGAVEIAIPCVTSHHFRDLFADRIPVPVVDGVEETAIYLKDKGIERCGIMATDGTVMTGLFTDTFSRHGIECVYPEPEHQSLVMDIIYDGVKAGHKIDRAGFEKVSRTLFERGVDTVILGCTELSVVAEEWLPSGNFTDVLDVLASRCVEHFGRLKNK